MVERGLVMFTHALIIALIIYVLLITILQNTQSVAENRSIIIGAIVLIYMILFGHGLPTSINKEVL